MSDIDSKLIEEITRKIINAAKRAVGESEQTLQTDAEHVFRSFFEKLGIEYEPQHNITIIRGRPDTLYGRAVIEYKIPNTLKSESKRNAAVSEAQKNIEELVEKYHEDKSKYVGIILDGFQVTFTKFRQGRWITEPIMEVSTVTVTRMLEYLRGLARKPLHPDFMVRDFGPDSELAKISVQILYQQLGKANAPRVRVLYDEWKKTFNQVCGYDFLSPKLDIKELVEAYEIRSKKVNLIELLFCIHTYYALVIKFLAAEITVTYASPFFRSFLDELLSLPAKELKQKLEELEEGGIFSELGVKNFLEGDFFAWYTDIWNSDIHKVITLVARKLSEYEPATATLEPNEVRDLLKRLYQYLVPRKIRHDLGEFFTPDWLAELTLDEVSYNGNPEKRLLDPACGSGTFLVLAIKRIREYADDKLLDRSEVLRKILDNVIGFDLNPLAVIAARTNYLIALGELLRYRKQDIFIPVYLSDSIAMTRPSQETLEGPVFEVATSVGKFVVPATVVHEKLIDEVFTLADESIKNHYEPKEFLERLKVTFKDMDDRSFPLIRKLYDNLLRLELKGINRIWARLIKNAFAPIFSGKFDFVVGNPPWINWEYLPEDYRESTKSLWVNYGLITETTRTGLGKVRRDLATLFVARSFDQYLNGSGKLGFLIPFNVLKTQGGDGFRTFLSNKTEVLSVHDLSETYPFEGATNRTGLLVIGQGRTVFPISCKVWFYGKSTGVNQEFDLNTVVSLTKQFQLKLAPIYKNKSQSPWAIITEKAYDAITKIVNQSDYEAYEGVNPALTGLYWVEIKSKATGDLIIVENLGGAKKKVARIQAPVEKSLVYPLARGRDVKKWYMKPTYYIIVPHDPQTGKPLEERRLKVESPKTFQLLLKFKEILANRSIHKLWGKNSPFYSLYDIGDYTFKSNKVLWKDISGKISAKGEFGGAVVAQKLTGPYLGKGEVIPDGTLMFIPCKNENEAHYVAAFLNSVFTRFITTSYAVLHVRGHILKYVDMKKFNPKDEVHVKLSELSKSAHQLAKKYYEQNDLRAGEELRKIENEIDKTIARLYRITNDELNEIIRNLRILKTGED